MKYFRMSYEDVLWKISFSNVNMLLATIPGLDDGPDPEEPKHVDSLADLEKYFKE